MGVTMQVQRKSNGALEKALQAVADAKRKELAVGFPRSKADPSDIEKAIWNNFGTRHIPPRPFLTNSMQNNRSKYKASMKAIAKSVFGGTASIEGSLRKLGIMAQGDVQREIVSLRSPANAASTIKRKGSSNPLIDTGAMRQAVTYHVRGK